MAHEFVSVFLPPKRSWLLFEMQWQKKFAKIEDVNNLNGVLVGCFPPFLVLKKKRLC